MYEKTIARRYMLLTKDVVNAIFVNAKEPRKHKACRIRNNHGKRVEDLISWLDDEETKEARDTLRDRAEVEKVRHNGADT